MEELCFKIPRVTLVGSKKLYEISKGIIEKIKFEDNEYHMEFLIVENMSHDAIIGTDELDKME